MAFIDIYDKKRNCLRAARRTGYNRMKNAGHFPGEWRLDWKTKGGECKHEKLTCAKCGEAVYIVAEYDPFLGKQVLTVSGYIDPSCH